MTKLIFKLSLLLLVLITTNLQAQDEVKIKNASGETLMEVREEGVIITKLTTSERTANATTLTSAESGLMVYDTDTQSFWVWKGTEWEEIAGTDSVDDADTDPTNELELPATPEDGTITYFEGGDWQALDPGTPGQFLTFNGESPNWQDAECALGEAVSDQRQLSSTSIQGFANIGQSFTAGKTGCLSKVRVQTLGVVSTATIAPTVEIQAGETETGTPISSVEAIPMPTTESSSVQWYEITFSNPAQVVEGNMYTIVLRANCTGSPDCLNGLQGVKTRRRGGNPYQGGALFISDPGFDMPFETFVKDGTNLFADADADPTNEIQALSKAGNTVSLSNNGGSFTDEVDDADADPTNEIQAISKSGNTVSLSNNGGSFTDEVDDADADPTNEIELPATPQDGTITYFDGGEWQALAPGNTGQLLTLDNGSPIWRDAECASGTSVSDQNSLSQDDQGGYQGFANLGQSFTAGKTGCLDKVRVILFTNLPTATAAPTVEILAGETDTGTPISSVEAIPIPGDGSISEQWYEINFSRPAQVLAGNKYTIVLRTNCPACAGIDNVINTRRRAGNPYPDGELLITAPNFDMLFETFVIEGAALASEVDDADADPTNELQRILKIGNTVILNNSGGSFTDEVDDADADPTNEIELPANPQDGTIAYYSDGEWRARAPGKPGQMLTLNNNGFPRWSNAPRFGFIKRTGTRSFNDEDGWEAITNTLTVDIGASGRVLIDAQATVRLTSGSLVDPFDFKVVANPSGSDGCTDLVDLNTIVHVPDTELWSIVDDHQTP
ncbi:MAG: hypothetical protein AAFO02_14405, partial [Bacteroidota bacterium]